MTEMMGVSTSFDRMALRRRNASWLEDQLTHPDSRFVPVLGLQHLVREAPGADAPRPVLLTARDAEPLRDRHETDTILLGSDGERVHFALGLPEDAEIPKTFEAERSDLRRLGALLPAHELDLLAFARGMTYWHRRHRYCGSCGAPTRSAEAGYLRLCSRCDEKGFPRTDPAMIVLVTSGSGPEERALLGRAPQWPETVYSTLAGFVEPGESLEQAVRREVREESGVVVGRVDYEGSQPWPFPSSLMIGFFARAEETGIELDREELEDARWMTRRELDDALEAGSMRLPTSFSISRHLIETWRRRDPA